MHSLSSGCNLQLVVYSGICYKWLIGFSPQRGTSDDLVPCDIMLTVVGAVRI
jgi:hypothetical protein